MKNRYRASRNLLLFFILIAASCSESHHNELIYRFKPNNGALELDSVKTQILTGLGTEMLIVYPDSDIVIIQYDRFQTNQQLIESHFTSNGYTIELITKTRIEEKNQPWKKK
ncbi:MAG: hypothetical protein KAT14_01160 [Candidatus Marinimicrobia bacterium]|nr:hypothetical protein [Candidatus Neomarinimicrobiota bacterium]